MTERETGRLAHSTNFSLLQSERISYYSFFATL